MDSKQEQIKNIVSKCIDDILSCGAIFTNDAIDALRFACLEQKY
jgi:hypothetical protein